MRIAMASLAGRLARSGVSRRGRERGLGPSLDDKLARWSSHSPEWLGYVLPFSLAVNTASS
jgi:hypothetical protein